MAEFDQPTQTKNKSSKYREEWWRASKLLQVDSLVAFVSLNGTIIFFTACDPSPARKASNFNGRDEIPSLFRDSKRASLLLGFAEYHHDIITWIGTYIHAKSTARQSLVEFPGVLLPSFQPTLQALQKMSKTLDLPFADIIVPDSCAR